MNFKTIFVIFYTILSFNQLFAINLIGNVLNIVNPIVSSLNAKKGSKLSMLDMLSGTILRTPEGLLISEGDIVTYGSGDRKDGLGMDGELWPNGVIPYEFHKSVDKDHRQLISEAMEHWEEHTCLRFRLKRLKDKNYIRFRTDTSGCWSSIGQQSNIVGPQDISLGAGCFKFYTAIHEIGHTVGYFHEHARKDRDNFVVISWNNVKPGMNNQFDIKKTRNDESEYDYRSVMHYPTWAFSKSPLIKSVILAKSPFNQRLIDEEKESLSFRDIKLTNILYKCNQQYKCKDFNGFVCKHGGILFPDKNKGNECTCSCAPGFSGKYCEKLDLNKLLDYSEPKCGANITKKGTFSTPNYPSRKQEYESCTFWIQAPADHRVQLTFHDFSFSAPYGGAEKPGISGLCLSETIEIRNSNDIYSGNIYCGEQIAPGTVMLSDGRDFIIIIIADDQKKGRGLKASVQFIRDETNDPIDSKMKKPVNNRRHHKSKKTVNNDNDSIGGFLGGMLWL